jgi:hypothetical protein
VKDQAHAARPIVAAWVSAKLGRPSSPTPHNSPSRYAVFARTAASAVSAPGYLALQWRPVRVRSFAWLQFNPPRHAETVELDLVKPFRP